MMASLLTDAMLYAFWSPGPVEMMIIAAIALLLYGGDLPQVARSWGKSLTEFRRGLSGIQNEINDVIYSEPEPERLEYRPENTDPEETTDNQSEPDGTPEETASDESIGSEGTGDYNSGDDGTGDYGTSDDDSGDNSTGDDGSSIQRDPVAGPDVS